MVACHIYGVARSGDRVPEPEALRCVYIMYTIVRCTQRRSST
jgi:hypothetical protein